jgi:hypothetical protein
LRIFFSFQFHQQLLRHFEAGFCFLVQQKKEKNNLIFKIFGEKKEIFEVRGQKIERLPKDCVPTYF